MRKYNVNSKFQSQYRITLSNRKIKSLEFKADNNSFVKVKTFQSPVTCKNLPKIYIIKHKGKIIYVGITSQSITNRLRYGFAAKGKGGYYGYQWKNLKGKVELLLWCFYSKTSEYVEAIEAELVYAIRRDTGKWPLSQTEIHFHNATSKEKILAQSIYKKAKNY